MMKYLFGILMILCISMIILSQAGAAEYNATITADISSSVYDMTFANNSADLTGVTDVSSETMPTESHPARQKWEKASKIIKGMTAKLVKQILPLVLRGSENLNISIKCSQHLFKFLTGIKQMKLWAFKMLDSSGKLPNGILSGTISSLGNFDECLDVDVTGQFQGRYCTVELLPPLPPRRPFVPVNDPVHEFINFSSSDLLVGYLVSKAPHYYYLNFRSSVCVPSTCSREDIEQIGKKVLGDSELGWDLKVPNCEIKESANWSMREIVVLCVVGFVLLLAVTGTIVDILYTLITKDEIFKRTSGSLLTARTMGTDLFFQFILNGFLNVETFFFISAVLVMYGRMKSSDKEFTTALYIFRRIWRLTPPFMFVIAFSFLVPHMGSGPAWKETVGTVVNNCKVNWWTNLLYFNNFVNPNEMCMQWMWYIPVDTHLYILALLVLLPIKHHPRLGFSILGLLFVASIVATAVSNIYYELHPAIYSFPHPDDISYFIQHGYFKTYLHAVTYCVGMVVGYVIATRPKLKIPMLFNVVGWLTAFILSLTILYGVFDWNQGNVASLAVSTLYSCTNKLVWSLALGWVTVSCFTGNGGIATSILSWSAFVPLSRLTYMAYLVHPIIQHMYIGSTRTIIQTEHRTLAVLYLGYIVLSYIVAYVFSQLFECPFMALEKVMFSPACPKDRKPSENKGQENEVHKPNQFVNNGENGIYGIKIKKTEDTLP